MDLNRLKEAVLGNKERVITGLVMVSVLSVILIINNPFLIWLLLGISYLIGIVEVSKLVEIDNNYQSLIIGLITWILLLFVKEPIFIVFLPAIIIISYKAYKNEEMKEVFPFLYPTISMIIFFSLYKEFGIFSVIWLIIAVAFTDTFAYFTGKYIGQTKFSPTSPNKTIEGVAGGVIAGTIFGSLAGLYFVDFYISLIISFLVSFFSVFGDLFESYLKRKAGVKDSGNLFPGHGGILDRLDGYLFGVIILYVGMKMV